MRNLDQLVAAEAERHKQAVRDEKTLGQYGFWLFLLWEVVCCLMIARALGWIL